MRQTTGQLLKEARAACGLTQKEVAEQAFGDASYQSLVSRWEADMVEPSLPNLRKLAPLLRLSLGDFTLVSSIIHPTPDLQAIA
ncbi:helix-turn-helix transcriptional regulator [Deinococcus humi]|uniref:Transcriptional regulator with XRE-family HTH domain n=1 Tax=Deinococcus humi TaxID=662880 RepID=A0A7W8JSH8_9DEIO|nr:helix-turn-helix transcriptional regulator [Deinococcus humi]MBB5362110.1 transcriptional regulator with XRE-family HTH domain [Deinococcus humi]